MDEAMSAQEKLRRVLVVTNIPNPYRIPLFNEIRNQLDEKGIALKVVFASEGYERRKFALDFSEMKFDYEFLNSPKISFGNSEKTVFTYRGLNRVIRKFEPDRIIVAGFSVATLKIYLRSIFRKTDFIIWG